MGFLNNISERRGISRKQTRFHHNSGVTIFQNGNVIGESDLLSKDQQAKAYNRSAIVYGGTKRIAGDSSSLKLRIWKENEDGIKCEVTNEKQFRAITQRANAWFTAHDLWEGSFADLSLTGEMYWERVRNQEGFVGSFFRIQPRLVKQMPDPNGYIKAFEISETNGKTRIIDAKDMVYIKYYNPMSDFTGTGSIAPAMQEIILNLNALSYARKFFDNSALPKGIIESEDSFLDGDWNRFREEWNEAHKGIANSSHLGVLPQGLKYKDVGMTQQDMQFMDQWEKSTDVILASEGIPPAVAGRFSQAIRANAETQESSYWTHTIRPMLKKLEAELQYVIVPMMNTPFSELTQEFETQFEVKFDFSEILFMQKNAMERFEPLRIAGDRGAVTPNEFRQALKEIWPNMEFPPVRISGDNTNLLQNLTPNGFVLRPDECKSKNKLFLMKQDETDNLGGLDATSESINEFILASRAARITIDQATRTKILNEFAESAAAGESISDLIIRLNTKFEEFDLSRAKLIARTEVAGGANFAIVEGYKQAKVPVEKVWLNSGLLNVRGSKPTDQANHIKINGETKPLDARFSNGLLHPGDQSAGLAEEVANCNCTTLAKVIKNKTIKESLMKKVSKQFEDMTFIFEGKMEVSLQDMFDGQENNIIRMILELDSEKISEADAIEIVTQSVGIGDTEKALSEISNELIIVAGNAGITQARRAVA